MEKRPKKLFFLNRNQQERSIAISKRIFSSLRRLLGRDSLWHLYEWVLAQQKNIIRFIKEHRTVKMLHLFRNYSAFMVVVSSVFLVSATNLTAGKESSGFLFGYLDSGDNYENPLANKMSVKTDKKTDLALAPLAQASIAPDPEAAEEIDTQESPMLQGEALVAGTCPVKKDPEEDGGVKIYEVQSGDTVSQIASKFDVTINTILWANELDNVNSIMPGDRLFILPVVGLSYTIKSGDNIDSIAGKYKANREKIIAFNDLPANGDLKEGETIIIPEGQKEIPASASGTSRIAQRPYESFQSLGRILTGKAGAGHIFPYGYCTWYVSQRRYVPWSGNAGTWLYKAKAMGYATGRSPRVGSIMVSSESWWGHVAIVEKISGGNITISEMNYAGWAKKSSRVLDATSRVIKGFIY